MLSSCWGESESKFCEDLKTQRKRKDLDENFNVEEIM